MDENIKIAVSHAKKIGYISSILDTLHQHKYDNFKKLQAYFLIAKYLDSRYQETLLKWHVVDDKSREQFIESLLED